MGQFGARIELRMGEDFGADDGLDDVEQIGVCENLKHPRRAQFSADHGQQRPRVFELLAQQSQSLVEGGIRQQVAQQALAEGLFTPSIDAFGQFCL